MPDLGEEVILARGPSRTVIVCWQVFVFPQASDACHERVAIRLFTERLVTVLIIWTVTELQVSEATGSSKLQESVADTVRPGAQVNDGAVVSRIVIVWVQLALVPQPSVAVQVRAITSEAPQPVVTAS